MVRPLAIALLFAAQTFKTGVELVTVPVTVMTRGNVAVAGLTKEDFRLSEDGVEQTITLVDRERRPVSLCIVLDSSHSMRGGNQLLAAAMVQQILDGLHADDEVSLVVFAGRPEIARTWTPARQMPRIDWTKWLTDGWTALVDAMRVGIGLVNDAKNPRIVILAVSDGEETGSVTPINELVNTRRQSEAQVYAIRTDSWAAGDGVSLTPGFPSAAPMLTRRVNALPSVIGDSGGTQYEVRVDPQVKPAARAFLDELGSQYILGYVPSKPPDGTYRRVKVTINNKALNVRHRGGYLAMPAPQ